MRSHLAFIIMATVLTVNAAYPAVMGVREPCWQSAHCTTNIILVPAVFQMHDDNNIRPSSLISVDRNALKKAEPVNFKLSTAHNWFHHLFPRHSLIERRLKSLKKKHDYRSFNLSINGLPLRSLIDETRENKSFI